MPEIQWRRRLTPREVNPMDPASVFKTLLDTAGVSINGWSVFVGKEPSQPHRAITCYNTGGMQPSPKWSLDYPSVQVRVRGFPNNYQESRAKIEECRAALLGIDPQDVNNGNDRLVSVIVRTDIQDLGFDSTNRPLHTVNFNLITQPQATGYRIALPDIAAPVPPPLSDRPLDKVQNAALAFSHCRLLRTDFSGDANVIGRASDGNTQGVGFKSDGTYNTDIADNFLASTTGNIVDWNDQSLNTFVASSPGTPYRPHFSKNLGLYAESGQPTGGGEQYVSVPDALAIQDLWVGGGNILMVIAELTNPGGVSALCGKGSPGWCLFAYPGSGGTTLWFVYDGTTGQGAWGTSTSFSPSGLHLIELSYDNGLQTNIPIFTLDGVEMSYTQTNGYGGLATSDAGSPLIVHNSQVLANLAGAFNDFIYEAYFYPRILTTDELTTLRDDIRTFYGTP